MRERGAWECGQAVPTAARRMDTAHCMTSVSALKGRMDILIGWGMTVARGLVLGM